MPGTACGAKERGAQQKNCAKYLGQLGHCDTEQNGSPLMAGPDMLRCREKSQKLRANPLLNGKGILNGRLRLGRQNKAIPPNKCSALKQRQGDELNIRPE